MIGSYRYSYGQGETNYPRPLFPPDNIISGLVSKLYHVFKNRYIEKGVVAFNSFQKNQAQNALGLVYRLVEITEIKRHIFVADPIVL